MAGFFALARHANTSENLLCDFSIANILDALARSEAASANRGLTSGNARNLVVLQPLYTFLILVLRKPEFEQEQRTSESG